MIFYGKNASHNYESNVIIQNNNRWLLRFEFWHWRFIKYPPESALCRRIYVGRIESGQFDFLQRCERNSKVPLKNVKTIAKIFLFKFYICSPNPINSSFVDGNGLMGKTFRILRQNPTFLLPCWKFQLKRTQKNEMKTLRTSSIIQIAELLFA